MAWIRTVPDEEAEGLLAELYAAARKRAGRIYNIVRLFSLSPKTMRANFAYYEELMLRESSLSRSLRELLAVIVSKANCCDY
ncbi:MAG: carboxymuconolactone decarboxylase family protein [Phycisphaerae bacterium]